MLSSRHTRSVHDILNLVREHLDMEVAFVGEFTESERIFRYVSSAPGSPPALSVGAADPLSESYCHRIVTGRLDAVIQDAAEHPGTRDLAATRALDVRAHIGAPIVFQDGQLYGSLCLFSHHADPTLDRRHLRFLRLIADLIAERLYEDYMADATTHHRRADIQKALDAGEPTMVFQPVVGLDHLGRVVGCEALARFGAEPKRSPDAWFADAREVGLSQDLELRAMEAALRYQPQLGEAYVAVNVSPGVLLDSRLPETLAKFDPRRVVVEITEHNLPADTKSLRTAIDRLRLTGVRIAIDDVGAGYSGLCRLLALAPDIIKLDAEITRNVAGDPARQAMVTATVSFSRAVGATLVAEGIEVTDDLEMLRDLGVMFGQGYFLGRPAPLPSSAEGRPAIPVQQI